MSNLSETFRFRIEGNLNAGASLSGLVQLPSPAGYEIRLPAESSDESETMEHRDSGRLILSPRSRVFIQALNEGRRWSLGVCGSCWVICAATAPDAPPSDAEWWRKGLEVDSAVVNSIDGIGSSVLLGGLLERSSVKSEVTTGRERRLSR